MKERAPRNLCYGDIIMLFYDKSANLTEEKNLVSQKEPPANMEEVKYGLISTLG